MSGAGASNRPLEEWGKLLSDVPTAGAILDRFLHHAQVIAITGSSYRVKEAPGITPGNQEGQEIKRTAHRRGPRAEGSKLGPGSFYLADPPLADGTATEETLNPTLNLL